MGGCASKPKDSDILENSVSRDLPTSPTKPPAEAEALAPPKEETNGGEKPSEAPLVDLSEPKKEGDSADSSSESKPAEAEAEPETASVVGSPAKKAEEEATAAAEKTPEPAKEQAKAEADPSSDKDKSDAPLVTI